MIENPGDIKALTGQGGKNQTLTDQRALLLDKEGKTSNTYRINNKKNKNKN